MQCVKARQYSFVGQTELLVVYGRLELSHWPSSSPAASSSVGTWDCFSHVQIMKKTPPQIEPALPFLRSLIVT